MVGWLDGWLIFFHGVFSLLHCFTCHNSRHTISCFFPVQKSTERLRHATERRQQKTKSTKMSMLKRLEESDNRRDQALRDKARRAGSENSKVEEVVFINTLQEQNRKRTLSERLAEGEGKRVESLFLWSSLDPALSLAHPLSLTHTHFPSHTHTTHGSCCIMHCCIF
jgi:hypothetical protein